MKVSVAIFFLLVAVCHGQFFPVQFDGLAPPPLPIARAIGGFPQQLQQQPQQQNVAHRAVVAAAEDESHLPEHMKNPFYKNPRIAQALAKSSWFIPGEEQVTQREAEKIPRQKVFSILKQAGFI